MRNVYLCQFSRNYLGQVYLPLSVGMLWAYARTIPFLRKTYRNAGFVVFREDPDEIVARMEDPDVVAFSTYGWNWEMSVAVARRVKERHPDCLVVFGGPHVPTRPDEVDALARTHPFIDVSVHGEGEITFAELLRVHAEGGDYLTVAGLSCRGQVAAPRKRATDLNQFPSPYLEGIFDEILMDDSVKWQATWETNRGCPYACTFCDWGGVQGQKFYQFETRRLIDEVAFFGKHRIEYVYGADANFGILPRDVELARALAATKTATGGYPGKYRGNYAKNNPDRVFEIATVLNDVGLNKSISLAVQSMDPTTLKTIKRKNMKFDTLSEFRRKYTRARISAFTEVIMGLPGETYESFREGIDALLDAGCHDSMFIYKCSVFPNAEMSDPEYVRKHRIATVRVPMFLNYTVPGSDPVEEYEDLIISTATLSTDEYKRSVMLAWIVQLCHSMSLTTLLSVYLDGAHGLRPSAFYEELLDYAAGHPETLIGEQWRATLDHTEGWVHEGRSLDILLPEFTEVTLEPEQASFLLISRDLPRFFAELAGFVDHLEAKGRCRLEPTLRADLLAVQEALVVKWDEPGDRVLRTSHSLIRYFEDSFAGEAPSLEVGQFTVTVTDPYQFAGDKATFTREIVMWGRRDGRTSYQDVLEEPLSAPSWKRAGSALRP